jgi:rhodanese-related sulfurtransferase
MSDSITPEQLDELLRSSELILIDVRRQTDLDADGTAIPGAIRGEPESLDAWAATLPLDRPIVVYCVRGGSVSKSVTPALKARGLDARYVEGGLAAWRESGGKVVPIPS